MTERAAYAGPRLCDSDRCRGPAVSVAERPTRALQLNQRPLGRHRHPMKLRSSKLGNVELELARVTVFLGANGAGKSSLLNEIKTQVQNLCPGKKAVYVEGGRAITLKDTLQLTRENVREYQDYSRAKQTYENKRQQRLSDRVYDALMMLERKELSIKASHSDAVERWQASGHQGPCPIRERPPLERLFSLFHEVFPRLKVEYDPGRKTIKVRKGEAVYPLSSMSDGEKQAFSILADFAELDPEHGLIIIDEPELNLHSELAERVWTLVESELPDRIFCYATHSLAFAMRPQVERVAILSDDPDTMTVIEDPTQFGSLELTRFLGSIPGIIAANDVVVTEGTEKSFDSVFFRWILENDQIEIMPAGDCEQVLNVCRRDGIWSRIAAKVTLVGIIDRDFRAAPEEGEVRLELREAESYLGIPSLVVAADAHLAIQSARITEADVISLVMRCLQEDRYVICAGAVAARCGIRLGVSVKRSVLRDCSSSTDVLQKLKESSQEELAKATLALGEETVERVLCEVSDRIDHIAATHDWLGALQYVDGKKIGNAVARMIGLRSALDLVRSVSANVKVATIPEVKSLADRLDAARRRPHADAAQRTSVFAAAERE